MNYEKKNQIMKFICLLKIIKKVDPIFLADNSRILMGSAKNVARLKNAVTKFCTVKPWFWQS